MKKGLIHIYCGDGKGKTTASAGLAIRAAGAGNKVVYARFLKGSDSGEDKILKSIPEITFLKDNNNFGFFATLKEFEKAEIIKRHNALLDEVISIIDNDECEIVILDEIAAAYNLGAVDKNKVDGIIYNKREDLELILTGRNPPDGWIEVADYISEINKVKHPFDKGMEARDGIEF